MGGQDAHAATPQSPRAFVVRMMLAAIIGSTLAVVIAIKGPWEELSPSAIGLISAAVGWAATLLFAPWKALFEADRIRRDLRSLTAEVEQLRTGPREKPLSDSFRETFDPDVDRLAATVRDLLAALITRQNESRLLRKRMDLSIEQETRKATAHLKREATTDPLTGLGNRRELERQLGEHFAHDRRRRPPLTVMLIDMDYFKEVNDLLGHSAGDQCLHFLGQLLASTVRREDGAIRLGGDEFVILMPDLHLDGAKRAAQRICDLFAQMPWPHANCARPTLSIGLARSIADASEDAQVLLDRADDALYAAKQRGRNMVIAWEDLRSAA